MSRPAEPTAAEIEAAARAQWDVVGGGHGTWDDDGQRWEELRGAMRNDARAALTAALPLVEARLREEIAQEIAEIKDEDGPDTAFWHGTLAAGMVARGATHRNGRALVDEWFARRDGR